MITAPKRVRGFTLLEVLVALVFFALIGMILQQVTASTVNQYLAVRYKMFSSWLAENKLTELQLSKSPPTKESKEDVQFANEEWQLVTKFQAVKDANLNKVEVDVYLVDPASNEKQKKLTLTGFIGRQ